MIAYHYAFDNTLSLCGDMYVSIELFQIFAFAIRAREFFLVLTVALLVELNVNKGRIK